MKASDLAWQLLLTQQGSYAGTGVNHEGQSFMGQLNLESLLPEKLMLLKSSAIGANGEVFHQEVSTLGRDQEGALTLFVNSNNHPGVTPHVFDRLEESTDGDKKIVFRFGLPHEVETFREEVALIVHTDQSLSHHYSWGLPGGEFAARSGSRMQSLNFAAPALRNETQNEAH